MTADYSPRSAQARTPVHDESRNIAGRKALFLGRRPFSYIPGLTLAESEELLDKLWAHAANPDFCWCHRRAVGDLITWDNRAAMYRRDPFNPAARRVMHRTQIVGTRPV